MPDKYVVVLSGGMDSSTLLRQMIADGKTITSCASFNYGQRHKKELEYAAFQAKKAKLKHHVIDLWSAGFTDAIAGSSSLVGGSDVPEGHYAADNMKQTVVPNRNMVMLAIAGSIAVAEGAHQVATAVHAGDHFVYPDCRQAFINDMTIALINGNIDMGEVPMRGVYAPFIRSSKEDIAAEAIRLNMDFSKTWSCYKGGQYHCGRCGTCVERLEAIQGAANTHQVDVNEIDKTRYEDADYWKGVING